MVRLVFICYIQLVNEQNSTNKTCPCEYSPLSTTSQQGIVINNSWVVIMQICKKIQVHPLSSSIVTNLREVCSNFFPDNMPQKKKKGATSWKKGVIYNIFKCKYNVYKNKPRIFLFE
jgi:hypothetical protein